MNTGEKNMMDEEFITVPYRKKRGKRPPKKADHKHEFVDCVFEFNPETIRYMIEEHECSIGSYCPICGKIGSVGPKGGVDGKWRANEYNEPGKPRYVHPYWTEAAEREFNPETRTLPAFILNDYFQKFVNLEQKG